MIRHFQEQENLNQQRVISVFQVQIVNLKQLIKNVQILYLKILRSLQQYLMEQKLHIRKFEISNQIFLMKANH